MQHTKQAFMMVELMIVVAIIGLLAMVAMPSFGQFMAKAKRTEAYVNLHSLYAAQRTYFAEHGKYATALKGPQGLGWQPEGYTTGGNNERFYYTYGFASGGEGAGFCTGKLCTPATHLARAYADEKGFMLLAAGDIDGDGVPDILAIDQYGAITIVQDDLT